MHYTDLLSSTTFCFGDVRDSAITGVLVAAAGRGVCGCVCRTGEKDMRVRVCDHCDRSASGFPQMACHFSSHVKKKLRGGLNRGGGLPLVVCMDQLDEVLISEEPSISQRNHPPPRKRDSDQAPPNRFCLINYEKKFLRIYAVNPYHHGWSHRESVDPRSGREVHNRYARRGSPI